MFFRARQTKLSLLFVFGVLLIVSGFARAAGVRPLVIEMNVRPGDVRDFEIALIPGLEEELVDLTLYEPVQQLSGNLVYQLPTNPAFSATSWVNLETNVVRVFPDAESKVRGRVTVPFSASGSHTVIIMVEPRPPEITVGIGFQIRYAVRLSIRVERPGLRQTAELDEFGLQPGDQGQPIVRAVVKNPSPWDYLVEGEATIRDAERRLVERITLMSPAGSSSGSQTTRVYPGSMVEFLGEVTKRLVPGEYTLRLYFRYGDQGQIVKNETITIAEGDFAFPKADEIGAFSLSPEVIEYGARQGERKSQVLEFMSEIAESARVVVETKPIEPDYPHSLIDWIQIRMAGNEFELPGRRNTRMGLTIAVPRDAEDGSYHGAISVKAYDVLTDQLLTAKTIPITVLVGDDHIRSIEVRSISVGQGEMLLDLLNTGNVLIRPQAEAVISDMNDEFLGRVQLTLPEGDTGIIPLRSQHLEGHVPALESGIYQVEISITDAGVELLSLTREIEVTLPD
jgi:hypothetical protein